MFNNYLSYHRCTQSYVQPIFPNDVVIYCLKDLPGDKFLMSVKCNLCSLISVLLIYVMSHALLTLLHIINKQFKDA